MSNSDIEQAGTVKGHISNVVSLSGHISIGSGLGDFIIKMTIEVNGNNYTVTSCDKTMEQIDAAVASGQNIKAIAFDKYVMPMTQMEYSESYTFAAFVASFLLVANVYKNPESGTDDWEFYLSPITADIVEYSNASMPRISTVEDALNKLVPNSHTHTNKSVLDKFSETDGKPTYDGEALGSGTSDLRIKMTLASDDDGNYTVTSCDTTVEQIDAAVAAEKRVVVITSVDGAIVELPMVQGVQGEYYYFYSFFSESVMFSCVYKDGDTSSWAFAVLQILSSAVSYSNTALPNVANVKTALDELVPKSHTHSNKDTLDKFSDLNGKLQYNGSDVGLKGDKGDKGDPGSDGKTPVKGTDYWTESDKAEIVNDTLAAMPTWTGGSY